jgi:hypothetical protein
MKHPLLQNYFRERLLTYDKIVRYANSPTVLSSITLLDTNRKGFPRKHPKKGGDGRTGVYMPKGTTSRVMVADTPYGEFYDFYSTSPEYFGHTLV